MRRITIVLVAGAIAGAGPFATPAYADTNTGTVSTAGTALNLRTGPATTYERIGSLARGTHITIACQTTGQQINGRVSTSAVWDLLTTGGYVSHAYVAGGTAPPCPTAAPTDPPAYIATAVPLARTWRLRSGIPASVTIAQAILESGWGRSALARDGNSQFGIKCFGWPGPIAIGCRDYATSECDSSGCHPAVASFRMYRSIADSYADHDRFLRVNPRYGIALAVTTNPDLFAERLQQAGYATDPTYAAKLIALMHTYNLYQY
jgi:mannosyl-glycoprotein endo-beta-N-acetylglucosaminidase